MGAHVRHLVAPQVKPVVVEVEDDDALEGVVRPHELGAQPVSGVLESAGDAGRHVFDGHQPLAAAVGLEGLFEDRHGPVIRVEGGVLGRRIEALAEDRT